MTTDELVAAAVGLGLEELRKTEARLELLRLERELAAVPSDLRERIARVIAANEARTAEEWFVLHDELYVAWLEVRITLLRKETAQ